MPVLPPTLSQVVPINPLGNVLYIRVVAILHLLRVSGCNVQHIHQHSIITQYLDMS